MSTALGRPGHVWGLFPGAAESVLPRCAELIKSHGPCVRYSRGSGGYEYR